MTEQFPPGEFYIKSVRISTLSDKSEKFKECNQLHSQMVLQPLADAFGPTRMIIRSQKCK